MYSDGTQDGWKRASSRPSTVAVLDWFSRHIVAWELDQTLEIDFVLETVGWTSSPTMDRALSTATPEIWNSDQGSHFTSPRYMDRLLARDVRISMDGKGRALDNIFTERLWRTVKYEHVYLADYGTPRALAGSALPAVRQGLADYLEFYDLDRPHQALGYRTPAEVYFDPDLAALRPELRQASGPDSFDTESPATDALYHTN